MDGFFQVLSTPYNLRDSDISDAASIMNGKSSNRIPVVYLSCKFDSKLPIKPNHIGKEIMWNAHVFVEPNRSFSQRLKIETHSQMCMAERLEYIGLMELVKGFISGL